MKPILIAHRGDTTNFPENTIEAFKSAFAHGAKGVELDVQFYKGNLVVVHDYLFDKSRDYPKLSEILRMFASSGRLELEIKSLDLDFLPHFRQLLGKHREADIEVTTSVLPIVHGLRESLPNCRLGIIFPANDFEDWMTKNFICTKIIKLMKLMKASDVHIPWAIISKYPSIVEACHANDINVHSHIYKDELNKQKTIYKEMAAVGVGYSTFDDISLIHALEM